MARREAKGFLDHFKSEYADTLCRIGEVLLSFSSGVLTVVTFGTAFWLQGIASKEEQSSYHSGLWQHCPTGTDSVCKTLPLSGPSYLLAARFFMCLALVAGMCAWVVSIIGLLQHKPLWIFTAAIAYAIQAFTMLLGLSTFAKSFSLSTSLIALSPGWSYSVGWLAFVLSVMCTLYFISVAVYRHRNPAPLNYPATIRSYAPLSQFESTETGSDDDDDYL